MSQDFEDRYAGEERPDPQPKNDKDRRKRQRQLLVRLSEAEAGRMEKIRERTALSAAVIVRRWIDDQRLPDRSTDRLVAELRRQGGLLKHCAYGAGNAGEITDNQMEAMLAHANELARIAHQIERNAYDQADSEKDPEE